MLIDIWYYFFNGLTCISFLFKIETGSEEDELEDSDSERDDMPNLSKITEMRFVPSDPNRCIHLPLFFVLKFFSHSLNVYSF